MASYTFNMRKHVSCISSKRQRREHIIDNHHGAHISCNEKPSAYMASMALMRNIQHVAAIGGSA